MATFHITLEETINLLKSNVRLSKKIQSIEATKQGPKIGIKVTSLIPTAYITIRFIEYLNSKAQFKLEGIPAILTPALASLRLPEGVSLSGDKLFLDLDALARRKLKINNFCVSGMSWNDGVYVIEARTE